MGDSGGIVCVSVHEHDNELVAAEPNQQVSFAQAARQTWAQLLEKLVAGWVAECVVDLLEVVEVNEEEGERSPLCGRRVVVCEERVEHRVEATTVAKTGEFIGERLVPTLQAEGSHPAYGNY